MHLSNANLLCETRLEELKLGKRCKDEGRVKVFLRVEGDHVELSGLEQQRATIRRRAVDRTAKTETVSDTVRRTEVEVEGDAEVVKDH